MATFQYLDEGGSEAQDRLATSFLLAQTSAGLATTGVLSGLAVTQTTTASGAVLVAAGAAPVQASVGTGVALLVNDTQATLDVLTANPMGGLPRNDIVAFDSVTKAIIAIIGDPNAAPTDPTVPATACALARLRHGASATTIPTAKIDSLIVSTTLAGVPQIATLLYTPTGNLDTPTAGSATWITLGNVTVPPWATRCAVTYSLNGIYEPGAATNVRAQIRIGAVGGIDKRLLMPPVAGGRTHVPISDVVTGLTPGSQSVTIRATWAANAASVRADTTSFVTAQIIFQA